MGGLGGGLRRVTCPAIASSSTPGTRAPRWWRATFAKPTSGRRAVLLQVDGTSLAWPARISPSGPLVSGALRLQRSERAHMPKIRVWAGFFASITGFRNKEYGKPIQKETHNASD